MKIIYNDLNIENEIRTFASKIKSDFEYRKDLEETIKDFKEASKGRAIGCPIPESFIDLGKYLFAFFLGSMSSGLAYDLVKSGIKQLLIDSRNKATKNFDEFIISDGDDPNNFSKNIYFYIPITVTDAEVDLCLNEISEIIGIIKKLQSKVYFSGSLRFYYNPPSERKYYQARIFNLKEIAKNII